MDWGRKAAQGGICLQLKPCMREGNKIRGVYLGCLGWTMRLWCPRHTARLTVRCPCREGIGRAISFDALRARSGHRQQTMADPQCGPSIVFERPASFLSRLHQLSGTDVALYDQFAISLCNGRHSIVVSTSRCGFPNPRGPMFDSWCRQVSFLRSSKLSSFGGLKHRSQWKEQDRLGFWVRRLRRMLGRCG